MKKASAWLITYCIVFVLFGAFGWVYRSYSIVHYGIDPMEQLIPLPLIFFIFVPLCLNPLAFLVQHHAKSAQPRSTWKTVKIVFRVLLAFRTVFWLVALLTWIF